jgi:hypothetical protein
MNPSPRDDHELVRRHAQRTQLTPDLHTTLHDKDEFIVIYMCVPGRLPLTPHQTQRHLIHLGQGDGKIRLTQKVDLLGHRPLEECMRARC